MARTPATDNGGLLTLEAAMRHFNRRSVVRVAEDVDDIVVTGMGIRGMAGNVSEWTASTIAGGTIAIVRGGSFITGFMGFGVDVRLINMAETRADVGVRCALTPVR